MSVSDENRAKKKFRYHIGWEPIVNFLPIVLLINAVVLYIGWLIWDNPF